MTVKHSEGTPGSIPGTATILTVLSVLRSGGEYRPAHVLRLRDAVSKHLTVKHRFYCLTDMHVDCPMILLRNSWPGWWSKIEMFHPDIPRPVLYFDLDTLILRNIDDLALGHRFTMLENFWHKDRIGSGMMAWDADLSVIYDEFAKNASFHQRDYRTQARWGDQGFIIEHTPIEPERWQRKFPGRVVSYKHHCRVGLPPKSNEAGRAVVPPGAAVVCYHGRPKPWETALWNQAAVTV